MPTPTQNPKPVAVVGISAEFPSGTLSDTNFDHKSFFDFLLAGQDAYERVPQDRFNVDGWQGSHLGQVLSEKACFLKDINLFDHFEFGISSKDAVTLGVATRKLIEHSFLALLDSGINSRSQNVGVYTSGIAFEPVSAADADEFDVRDGFGGGAAAVANRVSYSLDLLGPSIPVDTACSSSLFALHLGVQALRAGDCEAAVIGGSQINHRFLDWVHYSQLSIFSAGGKSSPFDASADGFGRGEAVVVFVIKLLEDAIRDGDHIYATVLNTAVNSTGSVGPVKTPIAESQAAAMFAAYKGIGRSPAEVDFVECHATGTSVGDPIEANWVGNYFKRDSELLIGSVKGNIGHTEIASFLASFTKVCSMFASNRIPPQVNYQTPNPAIHWDEYNMRVPVEVEEFKTRNTSGKKLVSINASGLLGANGHVIVESPPILQKSCHPSVVPEGLPVLIVGAGLSPHSATAIAGDLSGLASEIPNELPALSNIYGRRARQLTWRTAAVNTPEQPFEFPAPRLVPRGPPPLVFVFSGQGPQHIEMGRQLFRIYPAFRKSILRMDEVHAKVTGTSLVHQLGLFGDTRAKQALLDTWPVTLTVPSIAMIQMALVDLFAAFGIRTRYGDCNPAFTCHVNYNFHIMNGDKNDPNSLFLVLCAQKPSLPLISSSSADAPNTEQPIIFSFELARALDLQQIILDVMSSSGRSATIWIEATSGTLDGGVATGFARSLMRELVAIEIRLVLFDPVWTAESRIGAIRELSRLTSLESEIALDGSGVVLVPRLRSYAPRIPDTLDSGKYWTMTQSGTVVQSAPPSPGPDQVLVKISSLSHEEGGLQALVGTVARSRSSEWQVGSRVVAVAPSTRSNFVLVHEGQLSNIPEMTDDDRAINLALALVFVALGLRLDSRPLKSLKQIQVVVLHTGEFASSITRVLEHLGVKPVLIAPRLPLVLPRLSPGDIVLCGLPAESARTMPRVNGVSIFNWNDADHGALAAVRQNPWLVSTTIDVHLAPAVSAIGDMNCDSLTPEKLLPQIFEVSQSLSLADDKFYLIIGGIGALGHWGSRWRFGCTDMVHNRAIRGAVDYLRSFPDLDLRLEACDATSVEGLRQLIDTLDYPLAGCILSAASKTEGYFALEKVVAIEKLDFLLAISSVAGFGAAGLTNYASANTGIEYLTARYPNAWAFVSPGIADSAVGFELLASTNSLIEMWATSTMNSYEICLCLEDGLLRMANKERISLYVPNLSWDALYSAVNESLLYRYLVKLDVKQDTVEVEDPYEVLQEIVLKFVSASKDELEANVPLTSYGLDSLSAARMSTALKPYLAITQIQLLGDLSLDDLVLKMRDTTQIVVEAPAVSTTERPFAWDALHQPGQTILKLIIGTGTPLIILHGGAGDIAAFRAIQEQFSTPLWAIQPTPQAPLDTVDTLAQFYFEKIKEARPAGPHRIAGFSASSMVTLRLVQLFEANLDEIVQLTFVDHFPMIFTSPLHGFNENVDSFHDLLAHGEKSSVAMVADCCNRDSAPFRRTYGENLVAASQGRPSAANALESWEWIQKFSATNLRTLVEFGGGWSQWASTDVKAREEAVRRRLVAEVAKVRSPINVLVANSGLRFFLGPEWNDLGASRAQRDTRVVYFEAGHFDIFGKADFSRSLEFEWVELQPKHELVSMVHNPLQQELETMFRIVDTMSLRTMADTLKQSPRVGSEISRQRLFDVTEEFVRTQPQTTWTDQEYEVSKRLFPLYFEITDRIAEVHRSTVESPAAAVAALYSDDMMDGFYRDSPAFTSMNQEAAKYFKSLVSLSSFGRRRPLRVLEIGAGVGGLTKFLVEALCDIPKADVEYTITDLSFSLASSLAQSFTYKHIVPKKYDISKTPTEQGLQLGHYDMITGFNVVHAVPDLDETLLNLHTLLAPGGRLLMVDTDGCARSSNPPRPGAIWHDFVFGSFQGWFGFTDDRTYCTIDGHAHLTATGYSNVRVCLEDAGRCILFEAEKV
ncbi:hypothetical protein DFH08DRAFT_992112 [Mycena albidolilacea]|uniref:Ketosynthase family 3 (KS3) domain-containing protein n=1 Tax=Mycena albidolilacea TaxID=1033008 RepID=A0AAD7E7H2_9AGAR|nr:hypothetical protein DFH08DRAFT_992112 [Mycena albidolilacea]